MCGSTNSDCPRIHGLDNQMIINGDDIISTLNQLNEDANAILADATAE